ncbi:polysaccharide biosynthesis/export family protein [Thiohalobacter sp. IOR34]|uniref:polysaccharide biosynthesis/export family protein n=1 Tax=Thiohalobacter sp. IOR34 TaxID=3057176 RepID=UPI0025AF6016|nr:polysaccharide biosynthesis/export family protein [Thiohalobacter sp. IOR34]WJW75210.1 polysaccharide biosynthesis/export family protein [Thiohalobacter sp. IOR34]
MSFTLRICALLIGALFVSASALADATAPSQDKAGYAIQPGDVLAISVWKEEGLQREVVVRPDGALSFPLVDEIEAAGKTVPAIQAEISKRLERFIPDPVVTVEIRQLLGNKVYVIGKVNRPGEFPMNRYMDVVQALAMAGGMTPYAAVNKIKILRRQADGKLSAIPFEYGDIEKGRNLEQNIILQAGDVVVVP